MPIPNLYPKYLKIDLDDKDADLLMNDVRIELLSHPVLETDAPELKALNQKAAGIFSYYEAKKVLSPKQKERVIEFLMTIGK